MRVVVVVIALPPLSTASRASWNMAVVFPPPPTSATTSSRFMSSASASFTRSAPSLVRQRPAVDPPVVQVDQIVFHVAHKSSRARPGPGPLDVDVRGVRIRATVGLRSPEVVGGGVVVDHRAPAHLRLVVHEEIDEVLGELLLANHPRQQDDVEG